MALKKLGQILKEHPWRSFVVVNLTTIILEKLVEQDFVCPCRRDLAWAIFFLYLMMPLLIGINFSIYLWKSNLWSDSETDSGTDSGTTESQAVCKCSYKCCAILLTCLFPPVFWLVLFFGDGRYVACLITPIEEDYVDGSNKSSWEWCDKDRARTDKQNYAIYASKITVFVFIFLILLIALLYQCFDKRCGRRCGRCWGKGCHGCCDECCDGCGVGGCGGCCCGCCCRCGFGEAYCDEYRACRLEIISPSTHTVHCVEKHITERAIKYDFSGGPVRVSQREKQALCSVCDGKTVYVITLKGEQIDKLQEGKTYIIKDARVKEDHPYFRIILGSGTAVFQTAPLELNEKLICLAKESINPSPKRIALNDPELLQKEGYITLSGKVHKLKTVQWSFSEEQKIPVRDVVIEEKGFRVSVTLLQEAAIKPLAKNQLIEIIHVTVDKYKTYGNNLTSSDYTVVHVLKENTEESDRGIRVEGFAAEDSRLVLLTENQEELSVSQNRWPGDLNQLPQQLPVDVTVSRQNQDITRVDILNAERSSIYKVHCVEKHITERATGYDFSRDPVRVSQREKQALCSVCDGTTVFLITLKEEQIDKLQEGKTYIIKDATVEEDHPYSRIILESGTVVFQTAPLQLNEKLICLAKESINPSSKRIALYDPGLYQKEGYITLSGKVRELKTVQRSPSEEQKIPVRDVVIEENGFSVSVTLLQEAAIKPLAKNQLIEITHITVDKNKRYGTDLTSSDYTVVHFLQDGGLRVENPEQSVSRNLSSSTYKVLCVAKHIKERATKYDFSGDPVRVSQREKQAVCSVCDGTTVYLITLKGEQIDKLQKGKTYIIKDATVEEDHPYSRIILESGTAVSWTTRLQLDEKLICLAKESINPSSERTALYDPGLYQKEGYITLSGKVQELKKTVQRGLSEEQEIPVRDVVIEENGVSVSVTLLQEAAIKPLAKNQLIEITHITVEKNERCGTDLTSSDYTVVHFLKENTEESDRRIKVEGFTAEDNRLVLLTENQEELSVPQNLWLGDPIQLPHLPVDVSVSRRGQDITRVDILNPERSSTYKVICLAKHIKEPLRVSQTEKLALCSVCDGTTVYLITLKGKQIDKLQEGVTYIIKDATGKEDHPYSRIILGSGTTVFKTAPLQLNKKLITLTSNSSTSKRTALNDPELYLKEGYITLSGKVVSLKAVQQSPSEQEIPVRDVEIEENGVRVSVTLLQESATIPLAKNRVIVITHIKVHKNKRYGTNLTSSDYTVVQVLHQSTDKEKRSFIKVVAFATEDNGLVLLTENQEKLMVPRNRWPIDDVQLLQQLPVELSVTRKGQEITRVDI